VYGGPATKLEAHHAKATDGIKAALGAIYEPEEYGSERLKILLQSLHQEKAVG
jgi:hypothetical protein